MSDLKTKQNNRNVEDFLNSVENEQKRKDSFRVLEIMKELTGEEAKMWGPSIVGFGTYTYKYASGKEGDWMKVGFSPRKQNLTIYIMTGFGYVEEFLPDLGKYKTGKSCLYLKKLDDVDQDILKKLISKSISKFES